MPLARRHFLASLALGIAAPHVARAQPVRRWRCVTSWPRNLVGPGVSAERLAQRISTMSRGEIAIEVFAAGQIVPALSVLDAVSSATVEMGHTASLYWSGKMPVAPIFTTVPFGLGPVQHMAWLAGGGQALWDELYAPFAVKPFVGGNTGPSAAGWFRREISSLADLKGLRIRATGLGGELLGELGATAIVIPPGETYPALERGVIDAVELLAPVNDLPLGLARIAPYYALPGFNKPNGASETLISLKEWDQLPPELKAVVDAACEAEHGRALAEAELANGQALETMTRGGVKLMRLPDEIFAAARTIAERILDRIAATSPLAGRIVASYREARRPLEAWQRVQSI